jgi:hypothetical protein
MAPSKKTSEDEGHPCADEDDDDGEDDDGDNGRGSTRKTIFQIASGSILSIPIYLKTCLYVTPSLSRNTPKPAFFSFIPANKFPCF